MPDDNTEETRLELARRVADKLDVVADNVVQLGAKMDSAAKDRGEMRQIQALDHDALIAMKGTLDALKDTGHKTSEGINVLAILAQKQDDREEAAAAREAEASTAAAASRFAVVNKLVDWWTDNWKLIAVVAAVLAGVNIQPLLQAFGVMSPQPVAVVADAHEPAPSQGQIAPIPTPSEVHEPAESSP